MKKLLILCMVIGTFWACKEKAPVRYTVTSPEIDQVKTMISEYEKADWEAWMQHFADTAKVFHNSVNHVSVSEAQKVLKEGLANVSEYGFKKDDQFTEMIIDDLGDTWVYFWGTWEGTLAVNNMKVETPVHLAFLFKDNKIIKEYGFWDNYPMQEAVMKAMEMDETE
jgi:hypothetical protein